MARSSVKWVLILSLSQRWWPGSGEYPPGAPIYHWWRFGPVELRRYRVALPPPRERPALPRY